MTEDKLQRLTERNKVECAVTNGLRRRLQPVQNACSGEGSSSGGGGEEEEVAHRATPAEEDALQQQ